MDGILGIFGVAPEHTTQSTLKPSSSNARDA